MSAEGESKLYNDLEEAERLTVVQMWKESASQERLVEIVDNAAGFATAMRDKYVAADSPKVACKPKCHWCCHQAVQVSAAEAFRIAAHLKSLEPKIQQDLLDRLRSLAAKVRFKTPRERAKLDKPCAFLSYGQCSIYAKRPLACQRQTSYSVEECKKAKPLGFPFGSITEEKAQQTTHNAVSSGMNLGFREILRDSDLQSLELTGAVLAAVKDDAYEQWIQGGAVFDEAKLIADDA